MDNITIDIEKNKASFLVNELIYDKGCIMKTAYNFVDLFYIFIDYEAENVLRIDFKAKQEMGLDKLNSFIGEFQNELLNQSLRKKVFEETKNIRELILARALHNTCIENDSNKNENCGSDNLVNYNLTQGMSVFDSENDQENIGFNWFDLNNGDIKNE